MPRVLASSAPGSYTSSRQLVSGKDMENIISQLNSMESGITATAGGGKTNARQLVSAVNTISTVATAADSVKMPKGFPGLEVWVINEDADSLQAFGFGSDTIDGVATGTGNAIAQGKTILRVNKYDPTTGIANWVTK